MFGHQLAGHLHYEMEIQLMFSPFHPNCRKLCPPVSALQRLLHWSLTSLLLLTLVACSGIQIDEGCKRTVQPVCGVVEPAFCSIDEPLLRPVPPDVPQRMLGQGCRGG